MQNKTTLLGLALASALAVAGASMAGPETGGGDWHGHRGGDRMMALHQLDLSDAQRASIKQILGNSREQDRPARQALHQQREAFEAMTPTSAGYHAAAASLAKAEAQATQDRVLRMADLRARIYAVLTPAQQAQIATIKTQQQERHQQWEQFQQQHPVPSTAQ